MADARSNPSGGTGREQRLRRIADLHPGDHLCLIYRTDEEHRSILSEYIRQGLATGERVVYIIDACTAQEIRRHLRDTDLDLRAAEDSGQLVFLTSDESYVRQGVLDPQAMVALLREETQRALDNGFAGLRIAGEMTWALQGLRSSERLSEYETLLNAFFRGTKVTGLCMYDARHVPAEILLDVLRTHPVALVGTTLYDNPYYIPPEERLTWDADQATLNQRLTALERIGHLNAVLKAVRNVNQLIVRERDPSAPIQQAPMAMHYGPTFGVAVRLADGGQVHGVLTVGLPATFTADREELDLLGEVAGDLAYALSMIQVEEAQRQGELLLTSVFRSIQDGMSILDRDLTIQHVNHAIRDWYGGNEPLTGRKCYEVYQCRDEPCERCPTLRCLQTGRTEREVVPGVPGSPAEWLEVYSYPITDPDSGAVTGAVEFVRDITERKRAEEALHRTQFAVDKSPLSVFWISPKGKFIYVNETAAKKLGCSREELLSMHVWNVDPNHPQEKREEQWNLCREVGEFSFESVHRRRDGTTFPVRINSYHLAFEGQEIEIAEAQDITERKRAEERLQESEERFRKLFEESPVALFEEDFSEAKKEMDALTAAGAQDLGAYFDEHPETLTAWIEKIRFVNVNRSVLKLFGARSAEELIDFARQAAHSPAARAFRHEFAELFSGHTDVEHTGQTQNLQGHTLETVVRLSVIEGHEERLDRVLVSIQDVTPQTRAKEEVDSSLAQVRAMFEGTVLSLGTLAEMRDPYTAGHQRRVAELAVAVAEKMELLQDCVEDIRIASLLHDIGKSAVPAEILNKPAELSDLEFAIIQQHPQAGYNTLKDLPFENVVADIVLSHHERLDGSGYPQGLKGDDISLEVRIVAVADVVEAMASHRPYRPARGVNKALKEITRNKGTLYDPEVVDACLALFAEGFTFAVEA